MTDGDLLHRLATDPMSSSNNETNWWLFDAPKYLVSGVNISPYLGNARSHIALLGLEEKGIAAAFRAQENSHLVGTHES